MQKDPQNNQIKKFDKLEAQTHFVNDSETSSQSEWEDIPSSKALSSPRSYVQIKRKSAKRSCHVKKNNKCKLKPVGRRTSKIQAYANPERKTQVVTGSECSRSFSSNEENVGDQKIFDDGINSEFYDAISLSYISAFNNSEKLDGDFSADQWKANLKNGRNMLSSSKGSNPKKQAYQIESDTDSEENFSETQTTHSESDDDFCFKNINKLRKKHKKDSRFKKSYTSSCFNRDCRKIIEITTNKFIDSHMKQLDINNSLMLYDKTCYSVFEKHGDSLQLQLNEFEAFIIEKKNEISSIQYHDEGHMIEQADDVFLKTKNECSLFKQSFPAYGYRSQILNALKENQIVIVSSDCSYYFNIVTPVIIQSNFPDHFILSYESNDLANKYAKEKISSILESKGKRFSKINHVTDNDLIRILTSNVKENSFSSNTEDNVLWKSFSAKQKEFDSKDFIAILNIPLKRSIVLDLSLALLQDLLLKKEKSAVVLLLSIFDSTERFEKYFSQLKTYKLEVPKLLFPVKTVWKRGHSENYKEDVANTALSIHCLNNEGRDILAFLPNEDEAEMCKNIFVCKLQSLKINNAETVLLRENSSLSHYNLRTVPNQRTIFFTTDIAQVIPIPSVQYVIDSGLKRGYVFDTEQKINVLKTQFLSRANARLRKSLPCVYKKTPVCYRMYNKENFCHMSANEYPDILTLDPFDSIIKLFQYAPENAMTVEFIQPLNAAVKCNAIKELEHFKAVKNGKLSPLGAKIIKLPLPVRYSKFINQCMGWGYALEAVVIVAYFLTDSSVFKQSECENNQVINAIKFEFLHHKSDALSFLQIYKDWNANDCSQFWCDSFHIDFDTLTLIQSKVSKICQYINNEFAIEPVCQEFKESDDLASDLTQALLYSFNNTFSVFSGHHRGGYRILSSSVTGFIDRSSLFYNNEEECPQFLIFNKMVCTDKNYMMDITALDPDLVSDALTPKFDQILNYDRSDIFHKPCLIKKSIESVRQMRKGGKFAEIENIIQRTLNCSPVVVEPILNKRCIDVYAPNSFIDQAVEIVRDIIAMDDIKLLSTIRDYTLELKRGKFSILFEIQCISGAKILSFSTPNEDFGTNKSHSGTKASSVKVSLTLTWVRRPCNGICYIEFSEEEFITARKLSTKFIPLWNNEVYVDLSRRKANELLLADIPPETRESDIEDIIRERLPNVKNLKLSMMFNKPFETNSYDTEKIQSEIKEILDKCPTLSSYEVIVPIPQNTDTVWVADIKMLCMADLTKALKQISDAEIGGYKITAKPVYVTEMKIDLEIFTAIEDRFNRDLSEIFLALKDIFTVERVLDTLGLNLKLISSDIFTLQQLAKTVNSLINGEIIDKNVAQNINLIFFYGGQMFLKKLQKSGQVFILEECDKQIIRLYGNAQDCLNVKQAIVSYLENVESETVSLNNYSNNKQFLKALLDSFDVDLIYLIDVFTLCHAALDLKNNLLLLQGHRECINKAKQALRRLAASVGTPEDACLLMYDSLKCAVCASMTDQMHLQSCCHSYCCECFSFLVMQSNFPIQCCAEDCEEDVSLEDIDKIFANDKVRRENILRKSWSHYVEENKKELIACPMPGCPMFFKKIDTPSSIVCPLCQVEFCTICQVVCNAFVCSHDDF